jgi:hypothetical protein
MTVYLVVVSPFAGLTRGASITDAVRISQILSSEHAGKVVKVCSRAPEKES